VVVWLCGCVGGAYRLGESDPKFAVGGDAKKVLGRVTPGGGFDGPPVGLLGGTPGAFEESGGFLPGEFGDLALVTSVNRQHKFDSSVRLKGGRNNRIAHPTLRLELERI